jgi:hypothetical protein
LTEISEPQGNGYDCFRRSAARLLNVSAEDVPFFDPHDNELFWINYYYYFLTSHKLEMRCCPTKDWYNDMMPEADETVKDLLKGDDRWIAIVPSLQRTGIHHAIVMDGEKLEYDPDCVRVQKPKKFIYGVQFYELR